jgi:hypothetical protein
MKEHKLKAAIAHNFQYNNTLWWVDPQITFKAREEVGYDQLTDAGKLLVELLLRRGRFGGHDKRRQWMVALLVLFMIVVVLIVVYFVLISPPTLNDDAADLNNGGGGTDDTTSSCGDSACYNTCYALQCGDVDCRAYLQSACLSKCDCDIDICRNTMENFALQGCAHVCSAFIC